MTVKIKPAPTATGTVISYSNGRISIKEMVYKNDHEAEILADARYLDHHFIIVSYGDHPCAYVELNMNDRFYARPWKELVEAINCHGGLTYEGNLDHLLGKDSKGSFIGWDYAHGGDYTGMYEGPRFASMKKDHERLFGPLKKWSVKEIVKEVKDVIKQIIEANE